MILRYIVVIQKRTAKQKYKATGYLTLFDEEERQQRLSKIGNPLTEKDKGQEQKENNRLKSKTRSRVEHVFGFMECVMNKWNNRH